MRLFVIRHAEPKPFGPVFGEDPPLSATGRKQAACLAAALRGYKLDRVISSTMKRAHQTARPVAEALGVPLIMEPELVEIKQGDLPDWAPDFEPIWANIGARWVEGDFSAGFPGGENFTDVINRIEPVVTRLVKEPCTRGIAIVAHAVVNGAILPTLCAELRPELGTNLGHDFTGIWELEGDGLNFRLLRRNDTSHLICPTQESRPE